MVWFSLGLFFGCWDDQYTNLVVDLVERRSRECFLEIVEVFCVCWYFLQIRDLNSVEKFLSEVSRRTKFNVPIRFGQRSISMDHRKDRLFNVYVEL